MTTHYPAIDETVRAILDLKLAGPGDIIGCTPEQIEEIERHYNLKLPAIYREYLSVLGRRSGRYMDDVASGYPRVLGLRERAIELLEADEATIELPGDAFVFSMYQGFTFMFFNISDGDDPAVYSYLELDNKFVREDESFSQLLRNGIKQRYELRRRK